MSKNNIKIKVVHVIPTLRFGGAERLLADIAKYHDRSRFAMVVITVVALGPFEHVIRDAGVKVIHMPNMGDFGFRLTIKLWRAFRKARPDIVHTHLFGADVWGKIAAFFARVPVIVSTEHNTWFDESSFKHFLKRWVAKISDRIIVISRAVAEYATTVEKVNPKKIVVIPNRIELSRFAQISRLSLVDAPHVKLLSVGRLEEQKGFDVLLSALSAIRDLPWTLTIVGNGSLLSILEDRIRLLGLVNKVQLYGTTDEMPELYAQHDVFVLASRWEGLGLVIMEAMSTGMPVIATRVGGIPELIEHGRTGYLVSSEDSEALAQMVQFVIERRSDAQVVGQNARTHAHEHFAIEDMVRAYEQLYFDLLLRS